MKCKNQSSLLCSLLWPSTKSPPVAEAVDPVMILVEAVLLPAEEAALQWVWTTTTLTKEAAVMITTAEAAAETGAVITTAETAVMITTAEAAETGALITTAETAETTEAAVVVKDALKDTTPLDTFKETTTTTDVWTTTIRPVSTIDTTTVATTDTTTEDTTFTADSTDREDLAADALTLVKTEVATIVDAD